MKKFFSTIVNGYLGFLFPLIMTIILLEKLHHLIHPLVLGIERRLHIAQVSGVLVILIISTIIMILLGYVCGLLVKSPWVKRQISKFEEHVLGKIPIYNLIKSLIGTETGVKGKDDFRPALLVDDRSFSLCYVTSESDSYYTVYVCEGGLSGGELRIVPKEMVRLLDIHLREFTRLVKQYGVNSAQLVEQLSQVAKEK